MIKILWLWMNDNTLLIKTYDTVWKTIQSMLYDSRWLVRTLLPFVWKNKTEEHMRKVFYSQNKFHHMLQSLPNPNTDLFAKQTS